MHNLQTFENFGEMPVSMAVLPSRKPINPPLAGAGEELGVAVAYQPDPAKNFDFYCREVDLCWSKAIAGIVAMGYLLCEARMNLSPDEWRTLIHDHCPFDFSVACRLMQIAQSERVTDEKIAKRLPPSWDKLYQLMKLEQDVFQFGLENGIIHPKMAGKDITGLKELWKKRQTAAVSTAAVSGEPDPISYPKSTPDEGVEAQSDTADPAFAASAVEPEATEAAVKAPANNLGLGVGEISTAAPAPLPEEVSEGHIIIRFKIMLKPDVVDQQGEEVDRLLERLEQLATELPFIRLLEFEVAA